MMQQGRRTLCLLAAVFLAGCGGAGTEKEQSSDENAPSDSAKAAATEEPAPLHTAKIVTVGLADAKQLDALVKAHKGKVVLVDFWATWCGPCRKNFPHTVEMAEKYREDGLVVISVAMEEALEDPEAMAAVYKFLESQNATFDNLVSRQGGSEEAFEAFDVVALPQYRIYGRDGKVAESFEADPTAESTFTPEDIEQAVQDALAKGSGA